PAWTSQALTSAVPGVPGDPGGGDPGVGDTRSPRIKVATARTQKVRKSRAVVVRVTSDEAATVRIRGKVRVPGKDPKVTARRTVTAGARTTVKVRLSARTMRSVRRAWARKVTPVAKLKVVATDAAGNSSRRTVKV